jgi:hypothetical protein
MSRCKPGDLAAIVEATNKANIGRIVKVVAAHDGKGKLAMVSQDQIWMINAPTPLTWSIGRKRYRRKNGPAPDSQLQPIRGLQQPESTNRSRSNVNNATADPLTIE